MSVFGHYEETNLSEMKFGGDVMGIIIVVRFCHLVVAILLQSSVVIGVSLLVSFLENVTRTPRKGVLFDQRRSKWHAQVILSPFPFSTLLNFEI